MRRILAVLVLSLATLGLGSATVFAGQTASPVPAPSSAIPLAHPAVPAFPAAKAAPPPPTSAAFWGDRRTSQTFMNDSGFGCGAGTAVLGWGLTRTANESVYYNANGGGYTIHFQSCGNSVCVWVGSNQNGAGLYLAPCNGSAGARDIWYPYNAPLGLELTNASSGWYFTCWNAGNQCSQNNYDGGGGSVWNAYS